MEAKGAKNIVTLNDKFTTPNGAEGVKTNGTLDLPIKEGSDSYFDANYNIFTFSAENKVLQQVLIIWRQNDG